MKGLTMNLVNYFNTLPPELFDYFVRFLTIDESKKALICTSKEIGDKTLNSRQKNMSVNGNEFGVKWKFI
jgi:hypothetical protein